MYKMEGKPTKKKKAPKEVWFNINLWLNDPALNKCSLATRGLWLDILCWMWSSNEDFLEGDIVGMDRLLGCFEKGGCIPYLLELRDSGVAVVTITDEYVRVEGGKWFYQSPSRYIAPAVKRAVIAAGSCRYCGATEGLTVDHIIPFALGGTHDPKNLQCACQPCNSKKRTKSHQQFLRIIRKNRLNKIGNE